MVKQRNELSEELQEFKEIVLKAFEPMDEAVYKVRNEFHARALNGFGHGYKMQNAAVKVAPNWLKRWNEERSWTICFARGYDGLLHMAEAFQFWPEAETEGRLLAEMKCFYDYHENPPDPSKKVDWGDDPSRVKELWDKCDGSDIRVDDIGALDKFKKKRDG
jgi:hypothetical protein